MPFTHRIPQNVTAYESRIIGNFTPRQFIYLAIGGVIVMLLFMLPIPTILRFIGIAITAPISVAFALASFDGRRTDTWILSFSQAVLKPTLRVWQKEAVPPEFMLPSFAVPKVREKHPPKNASELENFLDFWRTQEKQKDYSEEEVAFLQRISALSRTPPAHTSITPQMEEKPSTE